MLLAYTSGYLKGYARKAERWAGEDIQERPNGGHVRLGNLNKYLCLVLQGQTLTIQTVFLVYTSCYLTRGYTGEAKRWCRHVRLGYLNK